MEVTNIIQQIEQMPLKMRFYIIEETLKSIKKEELNMKNKINVFFNKKNTKIKDISYLISEKSLANDWLSEEDNRWDKVL